MALLNLLQLLQSDDQVTFTDKCNWNFDQILSMGGGPIGPTGFQGIQGVPGTQGIQGFQGLPGEDGARWYVSPSSVTPTIPTPKIGDFWLQNDTLAIYEFQGSPGAWVNLGFTLASTGVFTSGGANNILFTLPSAFRSLVLSPINYGTGIDSPGITNYRLKLVGSTGTPLLRFGVEEFPNVENAEIYQPSIGVQKLSSTDWRWNFDSNGDTFFNLSGNYFAIYNAVSTVGRFDFGSQSRIQNNTTERLLSFASASNGTENFHVGRHTGISTPTDRMFTITDKGDFSFWGKGSASLKLFVEPGGISGTGSTTYYNNQIRISSLDSTPKSVIINPGTDLTGQGNGFVGIGRIFSEDRTTGQLQVNEWYEGKTGSVTHNSITYPMGVPFQAVNSAVTGTVVLSNPMTKFHVRGETTFGTRGFGVPYTGGVGTDSFSIGHNHIVSGNNSIVIGGSSNYLFGIGSVIIGASNISMGDNSTTLLGSSQGTHVSSVAPFSSIFSVKLDDFDLTPYAYNTVPILNVSNNISPVVGSYNIGTPLVLETRSTTDQIADVGTGLDMFIRDVYDTQHHLANISAMMLNTTSYKTGNQEGELRFSVLETVQSAGPLITAGPLIVGKKYQIINYVNGDVFNNVGADGFYDAAFITPGNIGYSPCLSPPYPYPTYPQTTFIAVADTPAVWTYGSTLAIYDDVMNEVARLKAGSLSFNGAEPMVIGVVPNTVVNGLGMGLTIKSGDGNGTGVGGNLGLQAGTGATGGNVYIAGGAGGAGGTVTISSSNVTTISGNKATVNISGQFKTSSISVDMATTNLAKIHGGTEILLQSPLIVVDSSGSLELRGNVRMIDTTFDSPPIFSSYTSIVGPPHGANFSTPTPAPSGNAMVITITCLNTDSVPDQVIFDGYIASAPHDRHIYFYPAGDADGSFDTIIGYGASSFKRIVGDVYNGFDFILPAFGVAHVVVQPRTFFSQTAGQNFYWFVRAWKFGL
jgi:hypothetical protein